MGLPAGRFHASTQGSETTSIAINAIVETIHFWQATSV
jgi:hypothetical protein